MNKPHLEYAKAYWAKHVQPGDIVIDATIGNGHDTLFLAKLLNGRGQLIGYDIQEDAINQTHKKLETLTEAQRKIVLLKHQSHACFEEKGVKLIVYNLGYLPGGDKTLTTRCETTLQSVQNALKAICPGGAISITCYPGHEEGAKEEAMLVQWMQQLKLQVVHHRWPHPLAPSLIWLCV